MRRHLPIAIALYAICLGTPGTAASVVETPPPADSAKLIWSEPGDMTVADWSWGSGGKERAPVAPFTFVKEDFSGTSPKIDVKDAAGVSWGVKFGPEVHGDTFTPRMVYAAGYFAVPTYFVPTGVIAGAQHLKRAKRFVKKDGAFQAARFKLRDKGAISKSDDYSWSWKDNPFLGTRELNGLKVLMLLTSNWDGKDSTNTQGNTGVFIRKSDSAYLYLFTDWGATMGKWGGFFHRSKWDPKGYTRETSKLVKAVKSNGEIEWGFTGKHKRDLTRGIRVADVRWMSGYLARFTDEDIRAGLASSGAKPEQVEQFAAAIHNRIRELSEISDEHRASIQK